MKFIHKPVRIEPAFEDREAIRAMFARHAPYRAIAAYIPTAGVDDAAKPEAERVRSTLVPRKLGGGRRTPCRRRRSDPAQQAVS